MEVAAPAGAQTSSVAEPLPTDDLRV